MDSQNEQLLIYSLELILGDYEHLQLIYSQGLLYIVQPHEVAQPSEVKHSLIITDSLILTDTTGSERILLQTLKT